MARAETYRQEGGDVVSTDRRCRELAQASRFVFRQGTHQTANIPKPGCLCLCTRWRSCWFHVPRSTTWHVGAGSICQVPRHDLQLVPTHPLHFGWLIGRSRGWENSAAPTLRRSRTTWNVGRGTPQLSEREGILIDCEGPPSGHACRICDYRSTLGPSTGSSGEGSQAGAGPAKESSPDYA